MSIRNLFASGILLAVFLAVTTAHAAEVQYMPVSSAVIEGKGSTERKAAFAGFDVVARYPSGVHSRRLGNTVMGNETYALEYKGVVFWFSSEKNRQAFNENPNWYLPPVGGYCLGAMSSGRLVPGFLQNTLFIPELQTWAVYGSKRGPVRWGQKSPGESRVGFRTALQNYYRSTGY